MQWKAPAAGGSAAGRAGQLTCTPPLTAAFATSPPGRTSSTVQPSACMGLTSCALMLRTCERERRGCERLPAMGVMGARACLWPLTLPVRTCDSQRASSCWPFSAAAALGASRLRVHATARDPQAAEDLQSVMPGWPALPPPPPAPRSQGPCLCGQRPHARARTRRTAGDALCGGARCAAQLAAYLAARRGPAAVRGTAVVLAQHGERSGRRALLEGGARRAGVQAALQGRRPVPVRAARLMVEVRGNLRDARGASNEHTGQGEGLTLPLNSFVVAA